MSTNLSPVLNIIYEAETARKECSHRVCELLSIDPTSPIARILVEKESELGHQRLINILKEVSQIVGKHRLRRIITDWPFENFWRNPHEPRHSKLLEYFIDPKQEHCCGNFLLGKFLKVLENSLNTPNCLSPVPHRFPVDGCGVNAESEYIDLCIERDRDEPKYAIILENKINEAINQEKQLQTYVDRVHGRGFKYSEIYVFYLPLTKDKNPDQGDLAWIKERGVNYHKITFQTNILDWLNTVLEESQHEWPPAMREGMRENLSHYRDLIDYLNRKQKELKMNGKILERLKLADDNNTLPTFSDVEKLKQDTESLQQCMKQAVRGKLLLGIQDVLQGEGEDAWLCLEAEPTEKISVQSAYAELFGASVNLCLRADDTVSVCFGANEHVFWLGYLRSGSSDKQKESEPLILSEAQKHSKSIKAGDDTYYWWWSTEVTYDNNCIANSSPIFAKTLVAMRNSLVNRLNADCVRS